VFPAPHRGTGDALASSFNRVTGLFSPIIKIATTTASGAAAHGSSPNGWVLVKFSAVFRLSPSYHSRRISSGPSSSLRHCSWLPPS
ncbi:hypothetical protein C0992_004473, partial [Termitomyces sp. T32_za158]